MCFTTKFVDVSSCCCCFFPRRRMAVLTVQHPWLHSFVCAQETASSVEGIVIPEEEEEPEPIMVTEEAQVRMGGGGGCSIKYLP
jgi:hypothetical protein